MKHDASTPFDPDGAPLAGVRIVDLTQYEAGPSATQMLAWMGADVIKIEPPRGEPSRSLAGAGPRRDSIVFALLNQSKRSVVLDLREDGGRETLKALIRQADVLAENFAPGTPARLGLSADELRSEFPRLIVASIRGYRGGGPWSGFKSLDLVAQAVGGAMSVNGDADGPPMRLGPTVADTGTGLHLAVGILAALVRRARTGRGGWVEVALQDAMFNFMRNAMIPTYVTGEPAPRSGSAYPGAAPSGLYPCRPGGPNDYVYLLISAGGHWEGVLRALRREDLIGNRPATNARRSCASWCAAGRSVATSSRRCGSSPSRACPAGPCSTRASSSPTSSCGRPEWSSSTIIRTGEGSGFPDARSRWTASPRDWSRHRGSASTPARCSRSFGGNADGSGVALLLRSLRRSPPAFCGARHGPSACGSPSRQAGWAGSDRSPNG
jgi:formyl-CoA transferase